MCSCRLASSFALRYAGASLTPHPGAPPRAANVHTRALSYALDGLKDIDFIASKMYLRGVVLVTVLHGSSVYASIADAESADCPLLDTRFPDFEQRGRALQLRVFAADRTDPWEGLTLWQRGLQGTLRTRATVTFRANPSHNLTRSP